MSRRITCEESEALRPNLSPWSSLTNYIEGHPDATDPRYPAHSRIEWCDDDEVVRLTDIMDADGCRHWDGER